MRKRYHFGAIYLAACVLLTACGAERPGESASQARESQAAGESGEADASVSWQGGAPEGLAALAERTEYYDFTVEKEDVFDLKLGEKNSREESQVMSSGSTVYFPLGTQFYQGEPVQIWAESDSRCLSLQERWRQRAFAGECVRRLHFF